MMKTSRTSLASRQVEPEILDHLIENDPRAIASRRDLRRLNLLMAQSAITAKLLRRNVACPPRKLLEIGAGDGSFMLRVARRLAKGWPNVELTLLDRQDLVTVECRDALEALGWTVRILTTDIFEWIDRPSTSVFDAISANLFLHHFDDAALSRLLAGLAVRAPVFVATEPRRAAFPLLASSMLRIIGANDVTRNDAPASVRAGFKGKEISALWPDRGTKLEEGRRGLFTHAFAASTALRVGRP
jgi:hypothetical protein